MENKRQEPGKMEPARGGTTVQGGFTGQTGEQTGPKRIRSLSEELPGMEAMLSDPGEPHKDIEQHSSRPEQRRKGSGPQQKADESQMHPLLGEETVSLENERGERARRKMEQERSGKKKPAA